MTELSKISDALEKEKKWFEAFENYNETDNASINITSYYSDIIKGISVKMKECLIDILLEKNTKNKNCLKPLEKRNLLFNGNLTYEGSVVAISLLDLKLQCELLNIDLKLIRPNNYEKTELSVLKFY